MVGSLPIRIGLSGISDTEDSPAPAIDVAVSLKVSLWFTTPPARCLDHSSLSTSLVPVSFRITTFRNSHRHPSLDTHNGRLISKHLFLDPTVSLRDGDEIKSTSGRSRVRQNAGLRRLLKARILANAATNAGFISARFLSEHGGQSARSCTALTILSSSPGFHFDGNW